ncbi:MAG: hypothetical protein CMN78_02225 [Spirochaetales bacterium]|nr:hypothetical protein [Spirochaetales bacterium]MAG13392.1 hypothetical protein [Spirochaetales bacterium]
MSVIASLLENVPIPKVCRISQRFEGSEIHAVEEEFLARLRSKGVLDEVRAGQSIAVAVGSRGIENQPLLVKLMVNEIQKRGATVFIVPAMGSHGGATADGQRGMLEGMGFTPEYIQAPIRATMDVVQIGTSENGLPVYIDRLAHAADGIVIVNRVKPHVAFRGEVESGLMKMCAIGLGKQKGAETCHNLGFGRMAENVPAIARVVISKANLLWAVALMENAYHETCHIGVLKKTEIDAVEPGLQRRAKELSPRLHLDSLDVLVIDEIGKNISGTGFDTNVVGRYHTPYAEGGPDITRIAALDLTEESHGNANGVGILDFTTKRLFDKMIFEQTYPNSLTSTVPMSVKVPMVLLNDRQAIQAAIKTCNIAEKSVVRLARLKNTLKLDSFHVSTAVLGDVSDHRMMAIEGEAEELQFDGTGNLF